MEITAYYEVKELSKKLGSEIFLVQKKNKVFGYEKVLFVAMDDRKIYRTSEFYNEHIVARTLSLWVSKKSKSGEYLGAKEFHQKFLFLTEKEAMQACCIYSNKRVNRK